jgi:hypothetical protein
MTDIFDPRSESAPDSVRSPVNWRLRNRIAAIVANQHRESIEKSLPDDDRVTAEEAQAMFESVLAALNGAQGRMMLGLNDLSVVQVQDLLAHAGESAEEELAELKLAVYFFMFRPEMRESARASLEFVAQQESARRRKQGIN